MKRLNGLRSIAVALTLATSIGLPTVASAQVHGWTHRHHKMATAGAGIGAYELAKHSGRNRAAHGGHRNFMQRHPVMTGLGAAALMHHHAKH